MIIYDKTNEKIESTKDVNISSLVERYNVTLSDLYFDKVIVCSLSDLENFFEDDLISEDLYNNAVKDFELKISKYNNLKDMDLFTFVDTEANQEIILSLNEHDAHKVASEKLNDLISFFVDYRDFELEVEVFANVTELLKEYCDQDAVSDFIRYYLILQETPSYKDLADYLGVTKSAVSQYSEIKKNLMIKGLIYNKIVDNF